MIKSENLLLLFKNVYKEKMQTDRAILIRLNRRWAPSLVLYMEGHLKLHG